MLRRPPAEEKIMAHAMQPNHMLEDTLCLLVYGWKCRASFVSKEMRSQLKALADALSDTDGVFVVAQSLVYVDGEQDTVVGIPVASVHADEGPKAWSIDDARAIERRFGDVFSAAVRGRMNALLKRPIAGEPQWYLVPT